MKMTFQFGCLNFQLTEIKSLGAPFRGHSKNQYNTCFWMLVKSGKSETEAYNILKGTQKQEKNEILFQQFGINYKNLPSMYRQGSCILKTEVIFVF
uniref:Putative tRNAHis guanylyltransferase Thg1, Thg1 C-terminal domain protein n=1 Tax=Helianthus annuus TaxID=4232 RepID=A0A251TRF0_HELAN